MTLKPLVAKNAKKKVSPILGWESFKFVSRDQKVSPILGWESFKFVSRDQLMAQTNCKVLRIPKCQYEKP